MLMQRVITGSILIFIVFVLVEQLKIFHFTILISLILLLATFEWSKLIGIERIKIRIIYITLIFISFLTLICLQKFGFLLDEKSYIQFFIFLLLFMSYFLCILFLLLKYPKIGWFKRNTLFYGLLGLIILPSAFYSVNFIHFWGLHHPLLGLPFKDLFFLLILIWSNDIAAFVFGKYFGKKKILPEVSPQKTYLGSISGVISVTLLSLTLALIFNKDAILFYLLLGLTVSFFATIGDFFESLLKREQNLKDIANYLPGHGGLLDRIDSLVMAVLAFYFIYVWISFLN